MATKQKAAVIFAFLPTNTPENPLIPPEFIHRRLTYVWNVASEYVEKDKLKCCKFN